MRRCIVEPTAVVQVSATSRLHPLGDITRVGDVRKSSFGWLGTPNCPFSQRGVRPGTSLVGIKAHESPVRAVVCRWGSDATSCGTTCWRCTGHPGRSGFPMSLRSSTVLSTLEQHDVSGGRVQVVVRMSWSAVIMTETYSAVSISLRESEAGGSVALRCNFRGCASVLWGWAPTYIGSVRF